MIDFASEIQAVVFDYGNTLVEYGPRQMQRERESLVAALQEIGPVDLVRLKAVRDRQIVAPIHNGLVENDIRTCCAELITEVCGQTPTDAAVERIVSCRQATFVGNVRVSPDVLPLLDALRQRYRVGLVSNYPCGQSIRGSLAALGITPRLESIVVSAEVGFAKPHPAPFELMLRELALPAGACVYVGDNWLADVQGSKRLGMRVIHTTQFEPYETHARNPTDHRPDATIKHIQELRGLLLE